MGVVIVSAAAATRARARIATATTARSSGVERVDIKLVAEMPGERLNGLSAP